MPFKPPPPDAPKPSIQDVARACGVSAATVSRVLNNRPGEVGDRTRERVLGAIRSMNYRPAHSRHTPPPPALTLGIASGIASAEYAGPGYIHVVVDALLAAAAALDHNSLLFASSLLYADPLRSIRAYCDGRCDGLIVVIPLIGSPLVRSLRDRGFPLVLVGDTGDSEDVACCDIDNAGAARLAVGELLAWGHRRIAFCRGPGSIRASRQREEGYRQTLMEHGITPDEGLLGEWDEALAWTQQVLRLPAERRPTALFFFSDALARAALPVIRDVGLRVPEDVSVIGIDDQGADRTDPPLTTIRQPYAELARCATSALLAQIRGETLVTARVILPGELVRRASVGPCP